MSVRVKYDVKRFNDITDVYIWHNKNERMLIIMKTLCLTLMTL